MMKMIFMMMMSITISIILMMICYLISKKSIVDREKMSPFECGFDPQKSPRLPFSIQFFMVAILFLIFDVEIAIILPMVLTIKSSLMQWFITSSMFIIILMLGLIHEWKNNILEWVN